MIVLRFVFLAGLFALYGCNNLTPFCNQTLELECTNIQAGVSRALENPSFCQGDFRCESWWAFFNDDQLSHLIERALACNPSIHIAEARIRLANYDANYVRGSLLPSIFSTFEVFRNKVGSFSSIPPPDLGLFSETSLYPLNVKYELDLWMKNRKLFYAALDELQATIADDLQARLLLSTAVAEVYFDLQIAQDRLKIAIELLEAQDGLYILLKQQFDHGLIAEFDVYNMDSIRMQTLDVIHQFEDSIEASLHALAAYVGGSLDCCLDLCEKPRAFFHCPFPLPCELPLDLIARRPDIIAQKWRIEEMGYKIGSAQASFYPNVNLLAYLGFRSINICQLITDRSSEIFADLAVSLPIFEGGKLRANLGIAQENFEIAIGEYNQLILDSVQEVSDYLTGLITADERLIAINRSVYDVDRIYDLSYQKFTHGISDYLTVLMALEGVLAQQDLQAVTELARLQAAVGLIRAIGGGYYECG